MLYIWLIHEAETWWVRVQLEQQASRCDHVVELLYRLWTAAGLRVDVVTLGIMGLDCYWAEGCSSCLFGWHGGAEMSLCQHELWLRSLCVCVHIWFCPFPLSSMSSCQNKLITITGAKAGIQKFISWTICIVWLCSAAVREPGAARCRLSNHSYLFPVMVPLPSCVVELKCSPRSAECLSCGVIHVQRTRVWEAQTDNYCNKAMTDRERSFNWVKIEFVNRSLC